MPNYRVSMVIDLEAENEQEALESFYERMNEIEYQAHVEALTKEPVIPQPRPYRRDTLT